MSVTLVHPAKAVGRNEMSFGGGTCWVVPNNIVLDRALSPAWEGEIWGLEPQFAAMPPITKLLWPSL